MNQEWVQEYDLLVSTLGMEYSKKYSIVEPSDIKQILWMWFVTHPKKYKEWSELPAKDKEKLIAKSLRNAALKFCEYQKARKIGYDVSDLYYYEPGLVEVLLPTVLMGNFHIAPKLNLNSGGGRPSAPAEGGNIQVMLLEIDSAYWKLSKEDRRVIFLRHAESCDFKEIANYLSLGTEDAARMRHKRAVKRLVNKLGGFKPYNDGDIEAKEEEVQEEQQDSE